MSILDIFVAYKFVKILSQPWKETDAYKLKIIDDKGNILIKRKDLKTGEQQTAYTIFHTVIWNLKRLLDKFPPTRSRIGSFATALWLLKEHVGSRVEDKRAVERVFIEYLREQGYITQEEEANLVFESLMEEEDLTKGDVANSKPKNQSVLPQGRYKLKNSLDAPDGSAREGDIVRAFQRTDSLETLLGQPMFKVRLEKNNKDMIVSYEDLDPVEVG